MIWSTKSIKILTDSIWIYRYFSGMDKLNMKVSEAPATSSILMFRWEICSFQGGLRHTDPYCNLQYSSNLFTKQKHVTTTLRNGFTSSVMLGELERFVDFPCLVNLLERTNSQKFCTPFTNSYNALASWSVLQTIRIHRTQHVVIVGGFNSKFGKNKNRGSLVRLA